MGGDITEWSAR